MAKFKYLIPPLLYILATWHAYAIIARPLVEFSTNIPFQDTLKEYSNGLLLSPSWVYFYNQSSTNLTLSYTTDREPYTAKTFREPSSDFLKQMRYYRCNACDAAAVQLYYKDVPRGNRWTVGYELCFLEPESQKIHVNLKSANFDSSDYKTFKTVEIECNDYR